MLFELTAKNGLHSKAFEFKALAGLWTTTHLLFSHTWHRYRIWRNRAESIRQLRAAEDHVLRDIGIAREDIRRAVTGVVEQPLGQHRTAAWSTRRNSGRPTTGTGMRPDWGHPGEGYRTTGFL